MSDRLTALLNRTSLDDITRALFANLRGGLANNHENEQLNDVARKCPLCTAPLECWSLGMFEEDGESFERLLWTCPGQKTRSCYFPLNLPTNICWTKRSMREIRHNLWPLPKVELLPERLHYLYPKLLKPKVEKRRKVEIVADLEEINTNQPKTEEPGTSKRYIHPTPKSKSNTSIQKKEARVPRKKKTGPLASSSLELINRKHEQEHLRARFGVTGDNLQQPHPQKSASASWSQEVRYELHEGILLANRYEEGRNTNASTSIASLESGSTGNSRKRLRSHELDLQRSNVHREPMDFDLEEKLRRKREMLILEAVKRKANRTLDAVSTPSTSFPGTNVLRESPAFFDSTELCVPHEFNGDESADRTFTQLAPFKQTDNRIGYHEGIGNGHSAIGASMDEDFDFSAGLEDGFLSGSYGSHLVEDETHFLQNLNMNN